MSAFCARFKEPLEPVRACTRERPHGTLVPHVHTRDHAYAHAHAHAACTCGEFDAAGFVNHSTSVKEREKSVPVNTN